MIWHSSSADMVASELWVDKTVGLSSHEVLRRLELYGKNEMHSIDKPNFWKLFAKQLCSYLNITLICTAFIYLVISLLTKDSNWTEAFLIIIILLVNCIIGALISFKNSFKVDNLKNSVITYATVIRDGIEQVIPSSNIVPGDIMLLRAGDYVRADGRIIEDYVFTCDEFSVSGEKIPVEKMSNIILSDITPLTERVNMVYAGSSVQSGKATVVVTETASNTAIGRAESLVKQTRATHTQLYTRLQKIGKLFTIICVIAAVVVFLLGVLTHIKRYEVGFETTVLNHLLLGLSLAVSAIPEGLPTVLSIAVAFSAQRLSARNITFMNLPSAESLGETTVICTDKTGVLTDGEMSLVKIFDGNKVLNITTDTVDENSVTLLHLALICSNFNKDEHTERHTDSVEAAIERACAKFTGMKKTDIDGIYPRLSELPFDSTRMMMTTVTVINSKPYAVIKGAAEAVLSRCSSQNEIVYKTVDEFADEGLKVMAVALKPLDEIPAIPNSDELENELIFVGILGFDNPPNLETIREVAECKAKGIRIIMLTGDYIKTSVAIGKKLDIIKDESEAISHDELILLSDDELAEKISHISVFARVTSLDKLRIVRTLRSCSEKVLLTCDTVKDLHALTEADFGCAFGITGSDSVKASADMIVNDNKFTTISLALKESNRIFDSVLRCVKYLLSCNAAEIVAVLFGLIIFGDSPLTAVSLLWINLITDFLPTLAFSAEISRETLSFRRHEGNNLLSRHSLLGMGIPAVVISVLTLIGYGIGLPFGAKMATTIAFGVLSVCEIVRAFALSHTYTIFQQGTTKNRVMPIACLLSLLTVILIISTPINSLLSLTTPTLNGWIIILLSAVIMLVTSEAIKYYKKNR